MKNEEGNMAPGQQNYPKNNREEDNKLVHPDEEINHGAQQTDQLEKLKQAAPNDEAGKQTGAQP